jgi:Raf kinase inhibitor-like YbhB/YbcL family protein
MASYCRRAKPDHGGVPPGSKVSIDIAATRGAALGPASHAAFSPPSRCISLSSAYARCSEALDPIYGSERFGTKRERFGTMAGHADHYTFSTLNMTEKPMKNPMQSPLILILSCLLALPIFAHAHEHQHDHEHEHEQDFRLTSNDIAEGKMLNLQQVLKGFDCEGGNLSPQLAWSGAPAGTKSFAITAFDVDAPTGSGWWHWTVFNLPATTNALTTGAGSAGGDLPAGTIQGRSDFGQSGFGGVCPAVGDTPHHYQFTVWALKVDQLPIDANASGAMASFMIRANALGQAHITARYGR